MSIIDSLLYAYATVKGLVMSWVLLPIAITSAFTSGGLLRLVTAPFSGGYFEKELAAVDKAPAGLGRIHFLSTGAGDAILLESDGHFALIDSAEDYENPKEIPSYVYDGYELYVADYVKRAAGGHLDFVLGTHTHSDHMGGFDTLILDPEITVDRAYLKQYHDENMYGYEQYWDNQVMYDNMLNACKARGVEVVQENLNHRELTLGNMNLKLFNGDVNPKQKDENGASLCTLVELGGKRAFLAGDLLNNIGDENRLIKEIGGTLDLLKAGHHGYEGSSTGGFLAQLKPASVVFTNASNSKVHFTVKNRCVSISNSKLMTTGAFGGVLAVFGEDGMEYYAIGEFPSGISGVDVELK